MSAEWIYEFRGRNQSGCTNQNLLWREGNIYVMDNHRAALWCWLQHLDLESKYDLIHIDEHHDCASVDNAERLATLPDLASISFDEYIGITEVVHGDEVPFIRWDNYLALLFTLYPNLVDEMCWATHQFSWDVPQRSSEGQLSPALLYNMLRDEILCLSNQHREIIVNIDLDYFFYKKAEDSGFMFTRSYRDEIFSAVNAGLERGRVKVLTISLSPDCCGGWRAAEQLMLEVSDALSIDFRIPGRSSGHSAGTGWR